MVHAEKYDVVVIGGGVAGLFFSRLIAEKGFTIALVEMKPLDEIGRKVCGDAIDKKYFAKLNLKEPTGSEVENIVKEVRVYSPSERSYLTVKGVGYQLNRKAFGQRLLREAMESGVIVFDKSYLKKVILKKSLVNEVVIYDGNRKNDIALKGRVFVDASGIAGALRTKLPTDWWISEKLNYRETAIAYREIRFLSNDIEDPDVLRIYLSQEKAPGGYWWFFPKGLRKVNVGLGIQGGTGLNPRSIFYKYIASRGFFKGSEIVDSGGGVVPTRRPLRTLVFSNVVAIGDAAFTANPIHGGGIGPSLTSAWAASKAVLNALEVGEISTEKLWLTNRLYIRAYGAKQGSLDFLRIFLQNLSDEDLNYIIEKKVISEDEFLELSITGDLRMSIVEKMLKALKFIRRTSLLLKLRVLADYMRKAKQHYLAYPENPSDLLRWEHKLLKLYREFMEKLGIRAGVY